MNINYNQSNIEFKKGTVILAGAGPGAIKFLTLKLRFALSQADVVIYDALVNKEILKFCKKQTKLIFAGKIKEKKACTQSEINEWLLKYSKLNKKVLRLKGGDISFFSRGSQEINYLKNNKVKVNVFSGITSSQAAAEISNSSFFNKSRVCNFITGHKKIKKLTRPINYNFICKNGGKIFIYMGVSQAKEIITNLLICGLKENEKVTIVYKASLKSEKLLYSNLGECYDLIKKEKIKSPAIIIIR